MNQIVETERLKLRQFNESDFQGLFELDSDPEVMRYISEGKPMTKSEVATTLQKIMARYDEWKVYGVWAAELKATEEFIGWFSLKPLPGTAEIEVGYRLLKKHWAKGFATEGSRRLVDYGLNQIGLKKIVAITNVKNEASKKVLKKIGLNYIDNREYQSSPGVPMLTVCWFEILQ